MARVRRQGIGAVAGGPSSEPDSTLAPASEPDAQAEAVEPETEEAAEGSKTAEADKAVEAQPEELPPPPPRKGPRDMSGEYIALCNLRVRGTQYKPGDKFRLKHEEARHFLALKAVTFEE